MNRKSIIVVVVVLCVVAFGFGRGWFTLSCLNPDTESSKAIASQALDQDKSKEDAVQVTQEPAAPADTARE